MGRSDVDTFTGRLLGTEPRHPVECLNSESVRCVRQQAPHLHLASQQAVLRRPVTDAVSAGQARFLWRPAQRAPHGVAQVCSAAVIQRLAPIQSERGEVYGGVDAARSRGSFYSERNS